MLHFATKLLCSPYFIDMYFSGSSKDRSYLYKALHVIKLVIELIGAERGC